MNIEQLVIKYCAPAICGIKPANMFCLPEEMFQEDSFQLLCMFLKEQNLLCSTLRLKAGKALVLVYSKNWLKKILSSFAIKTYLVKKGYLLRTPERFICEIFERIKRGKEFPHEIGIALGYPVEDVIAFEKSGGKNYKYCGIWKCWSNVSDALRCEKKYRECSFLCSKWFDEGYSLCQIIKNYKEAACAA